MNCLLIFIEKKNKSVQMGVSLFVHSCNKIIDKIYLKE